MPYEDRHVYFEFQETYKAIVRIEDVHEKTAQEIELTRDFVEYAADICF